MSRIVGWKPDRLRIEADLVSPGYVVLVDTYDPSWHATVDGVPADILRANVAFRAVRVPAGTHVVEMVCRPVSVYVGLGVSALTVMALFVGLVPSHRRPPARAPA
jgi:uncharacterized membrane protein YfhO